MRTRLFVLVLFSFVLLTGCEQFRLRKQLQSFMSMELILPRDVLMITNGRIASSNLETTKPVLVFYHGPESCSSCVINHMYDYLSGLEEILAGGKCEIIILFSPSGEDSNEVIDRVRELEFPLPICVDRYCDFPRGNKDFPRDERFHCFLLNTKSYPVFVGDPLSSKRLYDLFEKVLESLC